MSPSNTGRSLKAQDSSLEMGNVGSNYYVRGLYGVTDQIDMGFMLETGFLSTTGIMIKFSPTGSSASPTALAFEVGYGGLGDSEYYTLGATLSGELTKSFEVFVNGKLNQVTMAQDEFVPPVNIGPAQYLKQKVLYASIAFGFNAWITKDLGITLYGLQLIGDDIAFNGMPWGGSILFKY
jgi:hypothetical protein